jgi:phage terminase Nu1 subunit (DNA packaging protein)
MTDVTKIGSANAAQQAIARAKAEIAEENLQKGVQKLKTKYRELTAAKTVVANIEREVADLEQAVEQGNI